MPLFEWTNDFSVGVKQFDEQHKKIIDAVNAFAVAMKERRAMEVISDLFDKLEDYAANHFQAEERLMREHRYPEYDDHKSEHLYFKMRLVEYQEKLKQKNVGISIDIFTFLTEWIKSHFKGTDKKYSGFFRSKNVS